MLIFSLPFLTKHELSSSELIFFSNPNPSIRGSYKIFQKSHGHLDLKILIFFYNHGYLDADI